jgi:hypothetical protein
MERKEKWHIHVKVVVPSLTHPVIYATLVTIKPIAVSVAPRKLMPNTFARTKSQQ